MSKGTDTREQRADTIEQEKADWRWLMNDPRGRRIVSGVLQSAQVDEVVFNGNSRDAYALGRRSIGVELQQRAKEHALSDYLPMLKEQNDG